jgi:hypothetical protein
VIVLAHLYTYVRSTAVKAFGLMSLFNKQLEKKIAALHGRSTVPWSTVGLLLDEVDRERFWARDARSFSEWMKSLAPRMGVNESSLWRYLAASRYYQKLQKEFAGIDRVPTSQQLPVSISAENLEILQKLERVMQPKEFKELAGRVLHGGVTRGELRELWQTYRDILAPPTARGRGAVPPRVDSGNLDQLQREARTLTTLLNASSDWTGVTRPEFYRTVRDAPLPAEVGLEARGYIKEDTEFQERAVFDMLALVRETGRSGPMFVAVELSSRIVSPYHLREHAPFCDRLWIAITIGEEFQYRDHLAPYVGILRVQNEEMQVEREAKNGGPDMGSRTGELAKKLVIHLLQD